MITSTTMPTTAKPTGGKIQRHLRPAKKITAKPAASTSKEVPRSGCFMISNTGMPKISKETAKSKGRNCPSRFWNQAASIKGKAIFKISLGWITIPRLSHRVEPFRVIPNSATATNKITPTV